MLSKKTCLLLGAGASAHLGFPLGAKLRIDILDILRDLRNKQTWPEEFIRSEEDPLLFYERFAHGNWSSPDAFLEKHREFIKTGKYLICRCLASCEKDWIITSQGGWYDKLISSIHVNHPDKLKENKLSIVTFNYDRSIDFRLHKYVENQFEIEPSKAWDILTESIPIVHVHGTLGKYPESPYGDTTNFYERGQDIKIISEVEEKTNEFERASDLLNEADRVVVFGFGFAPDNVRRLNYFREQEVEDRDIIIATGPSQGSAAEDSTADWLKQWGLVKNKHHYPVDTERLFNIHLNPFR